MGAKKYSVEEEVAEFFAKTTVSKDECDARAKELVDGEQIVEVPDQEDNSYTVYAGAGLDTVIQFRLKSEAPDVENMELAQEIYGPLVPQAQLRGQLGTDDEDEDDEEALLVYVGPRIQGITQMELEIAHDRSDNLQQVRDVRLTLIKDAARFFTLPLRKPQTLEPAKVEKIRRAFDRDLSSLFFQLPVRFQQYVAACQIALPDIMSLPMVFVCLNFWNTDIMVDQDSGNIIGVLSWTYTEIEPFGTGLHQVEEIMTPVEQNVGASRLPDYNVLYKAFWDRVQSELDEGMRLRTVHAAMVLGLLLDHGFLGRSMEESPTVIDEDSQLGREKMLSLDSYLITPETRFPFLDELLQG